jgi:branched-chain amino acid transport system substrate-binding protein
VLKAELPKLGFEILETIAHPTPARDMNNVVLRIKSLQPDLVMPSHYYGEFVLMARTLQQQRVRPKGIYAIFGGAASSLRFVKEFPQAAEGVMDVNHWPDPKNPRSVELRKQVEATGRAYAYNAPVNYGAVRLIGEALEKAGSADRAKLIETLSSGSFDSSIMPYGQSKFSNGQNTSAMPLNTQVQNGDVRVIYPETYAEAKPVFPVKA